MRYQESLKLQKQQYEQEAQRDEREKLLGPIREQVNRHFTAVQVFFFNFHD
jgi:hypothetical protein